MRKRVVLVAVLVTLPTLGVLGQVSDLPMPDLSALSVSSDTVSKERELKLLQLNEAKIKLQSAWNEFQRTKTDHDGLLELYEKKYVSGYLYEQALTAWQKAQADYDTAEINLRRTELNFLQDASRISVIKATQRINEDGKRVLDFTLMNTSNATEAMVTDRDLERRDEIEALLRVENILVTVLTAQSPPTQIGKPFEIVIPALDYGETYDGTFVLQQEKLDSVQLRIEYLNKVDTRTVYMEKQSGEDIPRVTSVQFAQQGNAGESVLFDLEIERLAEDAATFALEVVNLPDYMRPRFEEQGTQLSQVKFPERVATRKINLRCYIPAELAQDFLDRTIQFFVVVGPENAVKQLKALERDSAEPISLAQIEDRKLGHEELQLTPRGRPELQIAAPQLYVEVDPGEPVSIRAVIRNIGTATLRQVRLDTDKPYDWIVTVSPELIDKIEPNEELPVDIDVALPEGIGTGIYDMIAVAKCQYQGEPVESPRKEFRINIKSRTNLVGTVTLVVVLLAAMIALMIFMIRLARR